MFRDEKLSAPLENAGTVLVQGASTFSSAFANDAGATLQVQGNMFTSVASLITANGFTNDGLIELTSTDGAFNSTLQANSGTLTNAADGTISFVASTGGNRTLNAVLDNEGAISADTSATIAP